MGKTLQPYVIYLPRIQEWPVPVTSSYRLPVCQDPLNPVGPGYLRQASTTLQDTGLH